MKRLLALTAAVLLQPLNAGAQELTETFGLTGAEQTWEVPDGVTAINIEAWGASGYST